MNLVAILAGGVGARMGITIPKQFLEFAGRTVLEHSVQAFENHPSVDKILIVMNSDYVDEAKAIIQRNNWPKVCGVIIGGNNRYDSSAAAIDYFFSNDPTDKLLIHDAARPLVSLKTVEEVIAAARQYGAAIAAVPEKNTVKVVNEDNIVVRTPERSLIWEVQTPQGFNCGVLKAAYRQAERDGFLGTDDASLVERLGKPVKVVQSEYENIKITTPGDMTIAEAFLHGSGLEEAKESVSSFLSGAAEKLLGKQAGSGKRKTKA